MKLRYSKSKYTINILLSIISTITTINIYAVNQDKITHEQVLANGLKVIVREDHRAPVIISQIWYKVGSSYESTGTTGISHMLEHMMFKASKNLKDGEFVEIIAKVGGNQNAMTSNDFTAYYQMLNKDHLETSFKLESERMQNLLLDPDVFAKEQQVVIEERRMRVEDNPISNTYERLEALAHIGSPYHHPVIGWPDDLRNYKISDLKSWYDRWYAPNNAIIVVVGDVQPKQVFDLANKYFSHIAAKPIEELKSRVEIVPLGARDITVQLPAKLPYLFMSYNVPSLQTATNKEEVYALDVISSILSGGKSARLPKILEREKEVVTSVNSSYSSFNLYNSLFTIDAIPAEGVTIKQAQEAILEQLQTLKTSLVTKEELERVKATLIANKVYEQDSIYYQALTIGLLESINLSWRDYNDYIEYLQAITPLQIKTAANKYFTAERLTVAVLEPTEIKSDNEIR
jgi:zinc protease